MRILLYIATLCSVLFLATCKKKTDITVKVFNPALNEYVAGAGVVLLEIKDPSSLGAISGGSSDCKEIASATTDANGVATFDQEKLKTKSRYHYKVSIKESWGIAHQNPCGGQVKNYLNVGEPQEIRLDDYVDVEYKIE
jgi:hypothetical protein